MTSHVGTGDQTLVRERPCSPDVLSPGHGVAVTGGAGRSRDTEQTPDTGQSTDGWSVSPNSTQRSPAHLASPLAGKARKEVKCKGEEGALTCCGSA